MIKRIILLLFIGFASGQLIDELEILNGLQDQFVFHPENIYKNEGLWYSENSDELFTGRLIIFSKDSEKKKIAECTILKGIKNGFFNQYYNNSGTIPGVMGLYINNKKEGAWTWIQTSKSIKGQMPKDSDFEIITSIDYRDGIRHGSIVVHKVNFEEFDYVQNYSFPRDDMFLKGQYFNGEKKGEWYYDDHLDSDFDRLIREDKVLETPFYWSRKQTYDKKTLIKSECREPWGKRIDCDIYNQKHEDKVYLLPSLDYLVEKNADLKINQMAFIKDYKGKNIEINDLKEFADHLEQYHNSVESIHEERGYKFVVNDEFRKKLNQRIEKKN